MQDCVRIENDNGPVATVWLNRPAKKNAWNMEMFDALAEAAGRLASAKGLRAVILRGAGGTFSAGLDLAMFAEMAGRLEAVKAEMLSPPGGGAANRFQRPVVGWLQVPVPVIAVVEGVCLGAGMQLALAADFRIAAPDARLSIMESKWGLVPDMGITRTLPRLVRADIAKKLIMTAQMMDAAEAAALGLVTEVAEDPAAAAQSFAETLCARSPEALAAAKRLVDEAWNGQAADTLRLEAELQAQLMGSPNQIEAVAANMAGRAPKYR